MAWKVTVTHEGGTTELGGWTEDTAKWWRNRFELVSTWPPGWVTLGGVEIRSETITAVTATEE